jgi:hypothetical protein
MKTIILAILLIPMVGLSQSDHERFTELFKKANTAFNRQTNQNNNLNLFNMSDPLKIQGRVLEILDPTSGVSKSGKEWNKQEFVVETEEQYPKNICFTLFNANTDFLSGVQVNDKVSVLFSVESREFNGKWYHNINAFNVKKEEVVDQEQEFMKNPFLSKDQKDAISAYEPEPKGQSEPDVIDEPDDLPF